jgi:hypothetical protein
MQITFRNFLHVLCRSKNKECVTIKLQLLIRLLFEKKEDSSVNFVRNISFDLKMY